MRFVMLLAVVSLAVSISAQPAPNGLRGPNIEQLTTTLELSSEQAVEVESILAGQGEKRRALMQEARSQGGFAGVREDMIKLRDETNVMLSKILSEEQLAKYAELAAERRARMRAQRGRPPG